MNSTTLLNKAEIQLYSTLISIMSEINRFKSQAEGILPAPQPEQAGAQLNPANIQDRSFQKAITLGWTGLQQAILAFLLWTILGFAAGFLLGMIGPR